MIVEDIEEPSTYQEAKDKVEWVDAMKAEVAAIEKNGIGTWSNCRRGEEQ